MRKTIAGVGVLAMTLSFCVGGDVADELDSGGGGADSGADASSTDGTTNDSGGDASVADASANDGGDAQACAYNDWSQLSDWTSASITLGGKSAHGLIGAAFDGQYIYYPSSTSSTGSDGGVSFPPVFFRYDTTSSNFSGTSGWLVEDATSFLPANAQGYMGAIFLGHYVYFTPGINANENAVFVRYDTTAGGFNLQSAWTSFDAQSGSAGAAGPNLNGYMGGVTDGKYVYFVPYKDSVAFHGRVLRYDPSQSFTSWSSWQMFDATLKDASATGFRGGVFDGRYVYFMPGNGSAIVTRYDTQSNAFTSAGSWETFALATIDANAKEFWGGVFDGRYVYFVPAGNPGTYRTVIARFDTQAASLSTTSAWKTFDLKNGFPQADGGPLEQGFYTGAFDGRYVYATSYASSARPMRHDTQSTAAFDDPSSWTEIDTTTVVGGAYVFGGTVFDGQYLYMSPGQAPSNFVRFKATANKCAIVPSENAGSFF